MIRPGAIVFDAFLLALLTGCGQVPIKPAATHLSVGDAQQAEGRIPPPVRIAPVLPKPEPSAPAETYSVVVNNVDVHDLLFALARGGLCVNGSRPT